VRAELIKLLDVKRPDIRARGDMIGIPLPNILVIRHFQERMAHGLFVPDVP
jgi:hypothetical protein